MMVLAGTLSRVQAQSLDDPAIDAAIKAAAAQRYAWDIPGVAFCSAAAGFEGNFAASTAGGVQPTGHYGVYLARAAGRVGFAAQQARRLYQKFEPVDVTQVMRDDSIVSVILEADLPARRNVVHEVLSPVQNIVLRTKGADTALQPSALAVTPIEWGNGALPHFPPIRYTAAMLTNS